MDGKSRVCEICGVRERHRPGFFGNFPIDEQRCRTWVKIVGKEDLLHIPIEKLRQVHFVCGDHFKAKDFNKKGNRLKKRAYPKLELSAQPLTEHQLKDFPQHVASKAPTTMDDSTKTPAIASSSKLQNPEATTQITMTSAPNHEEDVALVPPSGSKTPLATRQNVLSPSPILMKKKQAHVPKLDAASTTKETLMDWDKSKEKLIRQLNKVKSTVRSLKRNAILLDRLESSLCNWR